MRKVWLGNFRKCFSLHKVKLAVEGPSAHPAIEKHFLLSEAALRGEGLGNQQLFLWWSCHHREAHLRKDPALTGDLGGLGLTSPAESWSASSSIWERNRDELCPRNWRPFHPKMKGATFSRNSFILNACLNECAPLYRYFSQFPPLVSSAFLLTWCWGPSRTVLRTLQSVPPVSVCTGL